MATRLAKLNIKEVSGVDDPANELPGWLVMKSKEELEEILAKAESAQGELGLLGTTLAVADEAFTDAPQDVKDAVAKLRDHIDSQAKPEDKERMSLAKRIAAAFTGEKAEKSETVAAPAEAAPAPAAEAAPAGPEDTAELLAEIAKHVKDSAESAEATREVLSGLIDRVVGLEKATAGRTSLTGQEAETDGVEKAGNSLSTAFKAALSPGQKVNLS